VKEVKSRLVRAVRRRIVLYKEVAIKHVVLKELLNITKDILVVPSGVDRSLGLLLKIRRSFLTVND
jgi:hypothetical protein